MAISPDGNNVYVVSFWANSIAYWDRNSATGALTNMRIKTDSDNLERVYDVTVSPDNKRKKPTH